MLSFLAALNTVTPLGLAVLLGLVLYRQVGQTRHLQQHEETLGAIRENDLHQMPEVVATLQRIETTQAAAFATIIAKLNGH